MQETTFGSYVTQGDAMKKAKAIALEKNIDVVVEITKVLSSGISRIATVKPNNSTMGKWRFSGEARC